MLFTDNGQSLLNVKDKPTIFNDDMDLILNQEITLAEVHTGILKWKSGKSQGIYGIPAEHYKATLDSRRFPQSCSESILLPIYKSGARDDPGNSRGNSLLNVMYEIFSSVINDRITRWATEFAS